MHGECVHETVDGGVNGEPKAPDNRRQRRAQQDKVDRYALQRLGQRQHAVDLRRVMQACLELVEFADAPKRVRTSFPGAMDDAVNRSPPIEDLPDDGAHRHRIADIGHESQLILARGRRMVRAPERGVGAG